MSRHTNRTAFGIRVYLVYMKVEMRYKLILKMKGNLERPCCLFQISIDSTEVERVALEKERRVQTEQSISYLSPSLPTQLGS